jgi:pantoate--beta-alanine ligase
MRLIETVQEMQQLCRDLRTTTPMLGLVPTMGALHAGHMSLVQRARAECGIVAASIFVNPLQFAPTEDLDKYPRTFGDDTRQLEAAGVDILFAPSVAEMYPSGSLTTITVADISDRLDGASRPGHFTGVATVVAKLFHIVAPHRAYFGQKDAVQLAVLRHMVRDLNFDVQLIGCPIIRDPDGLALSSRNRYLTPDERQHALVLRRTLLHIEQRIASGTRDTATLLQEGNQILQSEPTVRTDYLAIVDPNTLTPIDQVHPGSLIAVAAWVGSTRLIDNVNANIIAS